MNTWQLNEGQIATIIPKIQGKTTEQVMLPDIFGDLWQEKSDGFPSIFVLAIIATVVIIGWTWLNRSQKLRDLLAAEPEPGQSILRKQVRAYWAQIVLLLLRGAALLLFDHEPRFALFGVESSISNFFVSFSFLPLGYIGISAVKHQILIYYPKGGQARIARGNWARAGGTFLLCSYLASWLLEVFV